VEFINLDKKGHDKMTKIYESKDSVTWDSGLRTTEPCIYVEDRVGNILASIQKKIGTDEYSVLFKGYWDEDGFIVTNDYYIPKQTVSGASVDYDENIGEKRIKDGYNVVAHSHPFSVGTGNYSGADDTHINTHFPCSLLTDRDGDITSATLKLDTPSKDYKIKIEIESEDIKSCSSASEDIVGMDNIKKKTYSTTSKGNYTNKHLLSQNHLPFSQSNSDLTRVDYDTLSEEEWKEHRDTYMIEKGYKKTPTGSWYKESVKEQWNSEIDEMESTYDDVCSMNPCLPF